MPAVNRNVTRTIKNTTETTRQTQSVSATTLAFNLQTTDEFYIGFKKPFSTRYIALGTANATAVTVTVKYWNGTAYTTVEDLIDGTVGLTQSGFLSWKNATDWEKVAQSGVSDEELYWIELTVGTNLDSGCTLQSVTNLFCDSTMLREYYPELVSDTSYLPPGRSDFMEQFVAAKNLVVTRLKKDKIIEDESQIIDINEVAIAAVHATAYIILNALATLEGSESAKERAVMALESMNQELNEVRLDLDLDNSGVIEEDEEEVGNVVYTRGG